MVLKHRYSVGYCHLDGTYVATLIPDRTDVYVVSPQSDRASSKLQLTEQHRQTDMSYYTPHTSQRMPVLHLSYLTADSGPSVQQLVHSKHSCPLNMFSKFW